MAKTARSSVVKLSIPCHPEFLRLIRLLVAGYLSRWNVPIDEVEYVKVAVSEACNSAVGCAEGCEEETLELRLWQEGARIGFEVRSKAAECGKSAPRRSEEEIELGLLLIRSLMEDVRMTADPEKGVRVVMYKSIPGPEKQTNGATKTARAR